MGTLSIALPDPLQDWVEEQVRSGDYADVSDYIRELIRDQQGRRDPLAAALTEAEGSGLSPRLIDNIAAAADSQAIYPLSGEERVDLEEALDEVERGELASDVEVEAVFARYKA
jgi:antitoxin ParD1/3/4